MSKAKNGRYVSKITEPEKEILDRALEIVHLWSGIPKAEIVGRRRFQALIDSRHFWWMLCLRSHPFTLERLGELVDRDHGSIVHAKGRHSDMMEVGQFTYEREGAGCWGNGFKGRSRNFKANWEYVCREYDKALATEQKGTPTHAEEHANSLV